MLGAVLLAWAGSIAVARAADAAPRGDTTAALALFDAHWEEQMRTYPEWATFSGDHRYGDRLRDASREAIAMEFTQQRRRLAEARAMRRDGLSAQDRTSLDVLEHGLQQELRLETFVGFRSMSLGSQGGFQGEFAELLQASPVEQVGQVEQALARMKAYPKRVEQELALLREGLALGWVPPRSVLHRVLGQIDRQLAPGINEDAFFEPFTRLGADIAPAEQQRLRERARREIADSVLPAMRRLRAFVADEYLLVAPADGALRSYPGGAGRLRSGLGSTARTTKERATRSTRLSRVSTVPTKRRSPKATPDTLSV
jgi:uncharacterized protein (DUF885 family)